jgi:pSer/pThr/pTyr-binding forkhead associated (FHA) protein
MTYNYLGRFLLPLPTDKPEVTMVRAADNDICLAGLSDADTVARYHARLCWQDNSWILADGGDQPSLNGVYVDGRRGQRVLPYHGVTARFGLVALVFSTLTIPPVRAQ